jgi:uncharacterized coiled-coil protein SlyX
MNQSSTALMPMPPKEAPTAELVCRVLSEKLMIANKDLEEANKSVRELRETIESLQRQVQYLTAQMSKCNVDGINAHDVNAISVPGHNEDVACGDGACDGKPECSFEQVYSLWPAGKAKRTRCGSGIGLPSVFTGHGLRICN